MSNTLIGGWELAEMQACGLPQQVASGFVEATHASVGAKYEPIRLFVKRNF